MAVVDETFTIEPPPLARIAGMACLQPRKVPFDVHRLHEAPVLDGGRLDVVGHEDAGVVDQHVQPPEALHDGGDQLRATAPRRARLGARRAYRRRWRGRSASPSSFTSVSTTRAALTGQGLGVGLAEAVGRAGHDAHLAVDPAHGGPASRRRPGSGRGGRALEPLARRTTLAHRARGDWPWPARRSACCRRPPRTRRPSRGRSRARCRCACSCRRASSSRARPARCGSSLSLANASSCSNERQYWTIVFSPNS